MLQQHPAHPDAKWTLVLGASDNPTRYSYLAAQRLLTAGHPVTLVGKAGGSVFGLPIHRTVEEALLAGQLTPHTVTLYLRPEHQQPLYDALLALKPRRILFNPGTENPEFEKLAQAAGIEPIEACTLVLLGRGAY